MANNYFQFKQFIIQQEKAAMKVGTDGVLLGAWACVENCHRILDVGTGTGLIALMLAQRNKKAEIQAIDIDEGAVLQAKENFIASPWNERLAVEQISVQNYKAEYTNKFDHIVSNPPYFNNSLKNNNQSKAMARHTHMLSFRELINSAILLTNENGKLSVVLPYGSEIDFCKTAQDEGFSLSRILRIKPTPKKSYSRVLIELTKQDKVTLYEEEMIIEDKGRHAYSDKYIELTKAFYIKM